MLGLALSCFQFHSGIVQRLQGLIRRFQRCLTGDQFLLGIQQFILFLAQLAFSLEHGIDTGIHLRLTVFQLGLGRFQFLFLSLQFFRCLVQLLVDRLRYFFVGFVDQILVQDHMQFLLDHACGCNTGNTRDALQLIEQRIVHKLCQLDGVLSLHGQGRYLYRQHGGVDLHHVRGCHHIIPAGGKGGDLLLDVHADGVHIDRFFKFQHDHADIFAGCGGHFLNMFQRGHGLLHGFGDLCLHLLRCGTGIGRYDHHIGKIHIGQKVRGHLKIGHHTQHQNGNHCHKYGQRFLHGKFFHLLRQLSDSQ